MVAGMLLEGFITCPPHLRVLFLFCPKSGAGRLRTKLKKLAPRSPDKATGERVKRADLRHRSEKERKHEKGGPAAKCPRTGGSAVCTAQRRRRAPKTAAQKSPAGGERRMNENPLGAAMLVEAPSWSRALDADVCRCLVEIGKPRLDRARGRT